MQTHQFFSRDSAREKLLDLTEKSISMNVELRDVDDQLRMLRAISKEKRLVILIALLNYNPSSVPFVQLEKMFRLNPNSLTRYLNTLMKAGLVENIYEKNKEHKGCYSFYRITDKGIDLLRSLKITKEVLVKRKSVSKN